MISAGKVVVDGDLVNASANVTGTLEFGAASSQEFTPTTNGVTNNITGTGTLTLKGAFEIDLTGADATLGNSWTLVDVASLTETFDTSFSVTGFTETAGVWALADGPNEWKFTEATGELTYVAGSGGYTSWIGGFAVGGLVAAGDDFDNDGMDNLAEYALNGNPSVSDVSVMPTLDLTPTDFEFTYSRLDLSIADTVQSFEYGSTLDGWTPIVIPAGLGETTCRDRHRYHR